MHSWITFDDDAHVVATPIWFDKPMSTHNIMLVNKENAEDPPSPTTARLAKAVLAWTSSPR